MSKGVGTHSFAMALLWTSKFILVLFGDLALPGQVGLLALAGTPTRWAAAVLPGAFSMPSLVGLEVVYIFQLGSNMSKSTNWLWLICGSALLR
jgi:hypothetical protein